MDATPVVSNGPDSMLGLLWNGVKRLTGPMLGQRWGFDEQLTASQLRDRFHHDPASLNEGLRCAAEYLFIAQGNVSRAFHQCSKARSTGDRRKDIAQSSACAYLHQLLPEQGGTSA